MNKKLIFQGLLWIGVFFFLSEFFFHFFGLPFLEHDKIFIVTHDRYIGIFALTYSILLMLISTNSAKYKLVFFIVMAGILVSGLNAYYISYIGGYKTFFPVVTLDSDLRTLAIGTLFWYPLTWIFWFATKKE